MNSVVYRYNKITGTGTVKGYVNLIALLGPEQSPQESMDSLLNAAFYQALKTSASAKKIEFPILTSNFFRQCTGTNKRLLKNTVFI
jgi:hypothetical protein